MKFRMLTNIWTCQHKAVGGQKVQNGCRSTAVLWHKWIMFLLPWATRCRLFQSTVLFETGQLNTLMPIPGSHLNELLFDYPPGSHLNSAVLFSNIKQEALYSYLRDAPVKATALIILIKLVKTICYFSLLTALSAESIQTFQQWLWL